MRPRALFAACVLVPFLIVLILVESLQFSVFAIASRGLGSSDDGSSFDPTITCTDNAPTPFGAALTGKVIAANADKSSCANFTKYVASGIYPDYRVSLTPADASFTLNVTPVLLENGTFKTSRYTVLHLEFSSINPNLVLQSFVIGGLKFTVAPAGNPIAPEYVSCLVSEDTGKIYLLHVTQDSSSSPTLPQISACVQPTMTLRTSSSLVYSIEPTPIQFADSTTTRWDIDGLSGSSPLQSPLPSVDLEVPGFPSDFVQSGVNEVDAQTDISTSTNLNNLTQAFMQNKNNFLAVAFDTSKKTTEVAGSLSIPSVTKVPPNDSILSPTTVDPVAALTGSYTDSLTAVTATPLEDSTGTPTNVPSNPSDPTLPSTCAGSASTGTTIFRTVWYSFTPAGDGSIVVDTAGSRYDTVLAVFTGTPQSPTLVSAASCDDDYTDTSNMVHSQARVPVPAAAAIPVTHGTPYLIMVGESPTIKGHANDSTGTVTTTAAATPLSNNATLFFSLAETGTPAAATVTTNPTPTPPFGVFGNQQVGASSAAQTITLTSTGGTPLSVSKITLPAGFTETDTCTSLITQGNACTITVNFHPTATGAASGNLVITDNVAGASPTFPLSGTGVDFTFPTPSGSNATGTLTSSAPATYTLSVSGMAGFSGSIAFACANLPSNTQCAFSPNPAAPGAGSTPVMLTVSRISNSAVESPRFRLSPPATWLALLLVTLVLLFSFLPVPRRPRLATLTLTILTLLLISCGGGGGGSNSTPPPVQPTAGSYPFTATATVSGVTKQIPLTLDVQ